MYSIQEKTKINLTFYPFQIFKEIRLDKSPDLTKVFRSF